MTDEALLRLEMVGLLRRLSQLGGFEATPDDREVLLDQLLQEAIFTHPADDVQER